MSKKGTGLAGFAVVSPAREEAGATTTAPTAKRMRGKGETVSLTVRVSRDQWQRLHELAVHEGQSLNTLALDGFSKLFTARGLKGL